ncbi:MAG TPA: 30S ribosomal protein S4 [Candidatus Saccharimonadia bacterium]|jgi:small subunit ribosomal protein S4|nr:30S ribosomal protein S4 [Candidatus Saccharimonadia bacterium]
MARNLTPIVKQSRREAVALHPKAIKGLTKHPYKPGQHGPTGTRSKPSQYSLQLRQKQMVKRTYGLLEKQFVRIVREAERRTGNSGDIMLQLLEQRLDNAVYRLGLAPSRQSARQLVTHGHFMLNGRRVDIPSIQLKPGDEFEVRAKSAANAYFKQLTEMLAGNAASVRWVTFDAKKLKGKVTGTPAREDITEEIHEQLIIEFYSR